MEVHVKDTPERNSASANLKSGIYRVGTKYVTVEKVAGKNADGGVTVAPLLAASLGVRDGQTIQLEACPIPPKVATLTIVYDGNSTKSELRDVLVGMVVNQGYYDVDGGCSVLLMPSSPGLITKKTAIMLKSPLPPPIQMEFDHKVDLLQLGVGGLTKKFDEIIKRVFLSRLYPDIAAKLKLKHVKGVVLYGPPGTGKTLVARKLAALLGRTPPVIVNSPDVEMPLVGQSEAFVKSLFEPATHDNALHTIIFDEFDAIGRTRSGTKYHDRVVMQLLACMDGIQEQNNVLVIALTNRFDSLDPALIRPGRFEVHIEVPLPDRQGRKEIFEIHTKTLREEGVLADDVDLDKLVDATGNKSGAVIEGVVKHAVSEALSVHVKDGLPLKVTMKQLMKALPKERELPCSHLYL